RKREAGGQVGDRPAAQARFPGGQVRRGAAAPPRREARHHRLGTDPRPGDDPVGRPDPARPLVRAAPKLEDRSSDPGSHAVGAFRGHVQGIHRGVALPSPGVTAVLFTCAGQRVDIVTAFREAGATTIACDVDQLAPALYHADRRATVPRVDDYGYVKALHDLVELHDVKLIVPLTDLDHH